MPSAREVVRIVARLCWKSEGTGFNFTRDEVLDMTVGEALDYLEERGRLIQAMSGKMVVD